MLSKRAASARGKDPNIDLVRGLPTYRYYDFVLKHAKNFSVHLQEHIANLIEK
jgi:hypothetical protein